MADYSPHRPHPSGRGWDAGCSTRQGPRKCRANTSRAQEPRLVSHLSGDEGGDETGCSTPGRRPHRIRSFDETEALAQCLAGELLAVEGPALRELLRPGKGPATGSNPASRTSCEATWTARASSPAIGIAIGSPARCASFTKLV